MFDRLVDIYREVKPSFVLTHSLADPYNVDHPEATRLAQEARIVAQAAGHKPSPDLAYSAPPMFLFEPHQPEQCDFKPNVILNIDEVWEAKRRGVRGAGRAEASLGVITTRVALNRGMQGGRNSGRRMTYGEAYQRLFPHGRRRNWHEARRRPQYPSRARQALVDRLGRTAACRPCTKPWAASG